ncbi:nucleoporin NDC1 [Penaeus vannamei]|uniref:nucleoporin NDC1 n=1 Tax=Penaeus vannamei TaxID=6689 RepID=UPI000F68AC2A|nr:nucleoporin NDC1-like [Penaeus vannamei]
MKLEALFTTEVLLWRYVRTLACLFLLQFFPVSLCSIYHTVVAQRVFNPLIITYNLLSSFSPSKLIHWAILALSFVLLARVHIKCYTVSSWVPQNRLERCKRILSPTVLFRLALVMIACALLANFYTSLAHPDFMILMLCRPGTNMCSKHMSVITFMSCYVGLCYAYKYFMQNGNLLTIAPAHPRKLQLIKAKMNMRSVKEACTMYGASKFSFLLAICFYMAAGIVTSFFSEGSDWKEWLVIVDLPLMILTATVTGLVAVTLALFSQIFRIFVTEPIQIPLATGEDINSTESDGDSWRLCHALSSSGLLQLLAFWDLKLLASSDPRVFARRSQVFAISQPGGHPRNWLGIMNPSLNLIRKFTERLRRQNCPEDMPPPPKPVDPTSAPTDVNKNEVTKPASPPLKERIVEMLKGLKKYPFFGYFLSELPDAAYRSIFAEALPVIWAVQAFGDLIAASFKEDKYGVVQRNIPDILMAFIHLQKVVDSPSRGTMGRRAGAGETLPVELQLRKALRSSLRSALYTVTTTFGSTVLELQVSAECQSKLQSYLDFKEG